MNADTTSNGQDLEPTFIQLERSARLRRFNQLALYLPLVVASLIAIALVVWMLIIGVFTPAERARTTISAVADTVLILTTIPLMLMCAVVPLVFFGAVAQARKREFSASRGAQRFFWRIDNLLARVDALLRRASEMLVRPLVTGYGWGAYVITLVKRIASILTRR